MAVQITEAMIDAHLLRIVNYLRYSDATSERRVELYAMLYKVPQILILRIGHDGRLLTEAEEATYQRLLEAENAQHTG